jgi:secondary thiamine-phosphate synthase enzyme
METIAPAPACRHSRIRVETRHPTEFIDLTDRIDASVSASGIRDGLVNVQTLHTTTAILVNENEPLLLADIAAMLERMAPQHARYRHDDMASRTVNLAPGERPNGHAHCRALLLGSSASLNLAGGRLQLGRWQRVFLVELDGPRSRDVSVLVLGGDPR